MQNRVNITVIKEFWDVEKVNIVELKLLRRNCSFKGHFRKNFVIKLSSIPPFKLKANFKKSSFKE